MISSESYLSELENDFVKFWIQEGILYNELKQKINISEEIMVELIKLRTQISNGENQYWCMDGKNIRSADKGARDYADTYGQDYLNACAVLVDSHVTKFIFNTFLKLKSPKIPMRVFTNKYDAVNWLLMIKSNNN